MNKNGVAKALKVIGVFDAICTVICGFVLAEEFIFFLAFVIVGFMSGTMFWGFAEIINLLQRNADQQKEILILMKDDFVTKNNESGTKNKSQSILNDIESNLPEM